MWIQQRNVPESLEILGLISRTCAELGGPLTKSIQLLVDKGDYLGLAKYEIDYSSSDVSDIMYARQILALFQKLDFLNLGFDKSQVAADRFCLSEEMCLQTNRRFQLYRSDPSIMGSDVHVVLHYATRKIRDILGPVPLLEDLNFSFGPGANTNVKGDLACPRAKLSALLECSSNLSPTVADFLSEVPMWTAIHAVEESDDSYICDVSVVPGKLIFVPKNAKTDRSICVEPTLNGFFQKGYGSFIRDRLLRFNINLRDQTRNQSLACQGSIDGSLATVDLTMASDCIATEFVREMLPDEWFNVLNSLRTSDVVLPSKQNLILTAHLHQAPTI